MATYDNIKLPEMPLAKPVYTIEEVATLLGVHRVTVSAFVAKGELRAVRLGHRTVRVTHEALMDFLKAKETSPVHERAGKRAAGGKKKG